MTADPDETRLTELEEDNRRLRRLLDQSDAPRELRHRLRGTVALLRAIVRRSAESGRDLPGYVAQLEDRLDAIIRAQAAADQHGTVNVRTLLADELFQYGASEGPHVVLTGPDVELGPRTGQLFALAVHELVVNAVEHGALGEGKGRFEVSWDVSAEPGSPLSMSWTEFSPGANLDAAPSRRGFGTEVLTRMLPYELKAKTAITFAQNVLRCTIRFPTAEP